jgi:hypothetical protein
MIVITGGRRGSLEVLVGVGLKVSGRKDEH